MTHVDLDSVVKNYPTAGSPAVSNLSLQIESGELVALLGPSGCGKTTTLKMIAGLLAPDSGDIRFDGRSVLNLQPEQRRAAMVFQNHLLFAHMNVFDNISFGLRMRHEAKSSIKQNVEEMLKRVQLQGFGNRQPHELSGGQQQRVAVARALITRPNLLLLDEPLSNLDTDLRGDMRRLIRELQRETGVTTIMVTHDHDDSIAIADRIALMMDGHLKQYSDTQGFINSPADAETARFFGGENFIPGNVVNNQFNCALGLLELQQELPVNATTMTIRAENIVLHNSRGAPDTGSSENIIDATLLNVSVVGNYLKVTVESAGIRLSIVCHQRELANAETGKQLKLKLPPNYLWAF